MTESRPGPPRRVLLLAHTGRDAAREVALAFCKALTSHGHARADARSRRRPTSSWTRRPTTRRSSWSGRTPTPAPTARSRWSSAATGRSCAPRRSPGPAGPRCSGVNLGHVGFLAEAESDDVEATIEAIVQRTWTPGGPAHARRPGLPRRRAGDPHLRAQRGQRREGRPRADDRGGRRDRQPAAVPVGLRRRGAVDADRLDRLQLQRRRAGRVAGRRGAGGRADQRARAVRPPDGRRARLGGRGRGDRPHRRRRRAVVRRPPRRGPAAGRPDRGTPRRAARCGWPGCTGRRSRTGWSPSSTCRSRAGAARPSAAAARRTGTTAVLEEIRIAQLGVIESSTLELGPGLTVITGETGAGKTMVVTALGLLLGARADSGAVRTGAARRAGRGGGGRDGPRRASPRRSTRPAARSRTAGSCWPATSRPRAGRGPSWVAPRSR